MNQSQGESLDGQPRRLTRQEIERALSFVFERFRHLQAAVQELDPTPPQGSPLAGDNRKTAPYHCSHAVIQQLYVAVEHLEVLRVLVGDLRRLYPSAPFTICRAAIETAATAVWLLESPRRQNRVVRTLQYVLRDAVDSDTAATGMGLEPRRPLDERRKQLDALVEAGTCGTVTKVKLESITGIVTAADAAADSEIGILNAWRVCSGFAHGRLWAWLSVLEKEELPGAPDGSHHLRMTSELDRLLWVVWAATDVLSCGVDLYRVRATPVRLTSD